MFIRNGTSISKHEWKGRSLNKLLYVDNAVGLKTFLFIIFLFSLIKTDAFQDLVI